MINRVFSLYADYNRTTLLSISTCPYETHRNIRGCLASLTVWRSFLGCIYKLQIILNLCEVGLYHLRQWVICSNRQKSNHNNTYQNCKLLIHNAEMLNIDLIFRRLLYPQNYFILNFYMCYPTALASLSLSLCSTWIREEMSLTSGEPLFSPAQQFLLSHVFCVVSDSFSTDLQWFLEH